MPLHALVEGMLGNGTIIWSSTLVYIGRLPLSQMSIITPCGIRTARSSFRSLQVRLILSQTEPWFCGYISSPIDPAARWASVYGVPKGLTVGHEMARQELCIGKQSCLPINVQEAYDKATNDHEPVLLWSGSVVNPFPQLSLTLKMSEKAHHKGQKPKWMTFDSVVFDGVYPRSNSGRL